MRWFVYLLYVTTVDVPICGKSGSRDTYVGMTNDVITRVQRHNSGQVTATRGRSWRLRAYIGVATQAEAAMLERWFKCGDTRGKRIKFALCGLDGTGTSEYTAEIREAAKLWARKHPGMQFNRQELSK